MSGLATGASWLCYFQAPKLCDAARVAPVDKLSIVLVAVFGVAFLGERLTPANWLGIVLIGCGALLVVSKGWNSATWLIDRNQLRRQWFCLSPNGGRRRKQRPNQLLQHRNHASKCDA